MNKEEFDKLYPILCNYVKENVDENRFLHTLGVVKAAEKYALKYHADVYKAKIAAIFHDACKTSNKGLEHGEAASKLLLEKFHVEDEEILLAIKNHTIGRINPCLLEKVIKLADLLEEGRTYEDVALIRRYDDEYNDIDKTYLYLLKRQREVLIEKGIDYDKRTDEIIEHMENKEKELIKEKAINFAKILDKYKALDISIVDISEKSGFADYFVIATAGNLRQLSSLSSNLEDDLAKENILVDHIEGRGDSGWILLDYKDIIVNIFTLEQRNHYDLDKVWSDCNRIEFIQEEM